MQHERVIDRQLDVVWADLAQSTPAPAGSSTWQVRVEPITDGFQHERCVAGTGSRRYERELHSGTHGILAVREVIAATATGTSTIVQVSVSTFDRSLTTELASAYLTAVDAAASGSDGDARPLLDRQRVVVSPGGDAIEDA